MIDINDGRVVYYSWADGNELEKCINKLNKFEEHYVDIDIFDYCELKHILKYLNDKNENIKRILNDKEIDVKKEKALIHETINKFEYYYIFQELEKWQEDDSFFVYIKDYIEYLFDKNIINKRIITDMFKLESNPINLVFEELSNLENKGKLKDQVKELEILDTLLTDDKYIYSLIFIIDKLSLNTDIFKGYEKIFLEKLEKFLNKMGEGNQPHDWGLIYNSKNKIYTPEIKYLAEQKEQEYWKAFFDAGKGHSMGGLRFETKSNIKDMEIRFEDGNFSYAYNPNYALGITYRYQNSLFVFYFFEFLNNVSGNFSDIVKNKFFPSISDFFNSNKYDYVKNDHAFTVMFNLRVMQLNSYINELKERGISFEKQLAYYIEVYLIKEYNLSFDVKSDLENLVETDSYNYKCRIMCTMIESICNQYKEIVNNGDFDLNYLMKYGTFNLNKMKATGIKRISLKKSSNTTAYMHFFNNQSSLYQKDKKCDFYTYVSDNKVYYSNMIKDKKSVKKKLDLLIERGLIVVENDVISIVKKDKILIMKALLQEESFVIKPHIDKQIITELLEEGEVEEETNLFSSKEIDYLNYHLNNKQFDDSLALRNKYQHNGHTGKVDMDLWNYLVLLKILILILLRIEQDQELAEKLELKNYK